MAAFIISRVVVHDRDLMSKYIAASVPLAKSHGAKYRARAEDVVAADGEFPGGRVVIIEFPTLEDLKAFVYSPEYQEIRKLRLQSTESHVWIVPGEDSGAAGMNGLL